MQSISHQPLTANAPKFGPSYLYLSTSFQVSSFLSPCPSSSHSSAVPFSFCPVGSTFKSLPNYSGTYMYVLSNSVSTSQFVYYWFLICSLPQFFAGDLVWLSDSDYCSQAPIDKGLDHLLVLPCSQTLIAILSAKWFSHWIQKP